MSDTRGLIRAILWLQLGLALVLFGADLLRVLPTLALPSRAPELTEPLRPGDQTRRYRPSEIAPRAPQGPQPGSRPVPVFDDMPSRLAFDVARWEGRETLSLTGAIAPGDAERLRVVLQGSAAQPELVYLNSPGGAVADALAIGRQLRALEVETRMFGTDICLSACPYMLAAGVVRTLESGAMVGVHQHFFGENKALPAFLAVEDIQRGQGEVMAYLVEMGIDPLLMQPALMTPPDEIYLLTEAELADYGLAPWPAPEPES